MCHLSIRDKDAGTFPSRKSAQKARRNREKTNKERETLSLILIEYLKSARNKRGRATYRTKQPHAIQQRIVAYALARIRARVRNELRARAHVRNAHALGQVAYLGNAVKMAFFLKKAHKKSAEYTFYLSKKYQKLGANGRFN